MSHLRPPSAQPIVADTSGYLATAWEVFMQDLCNQLAELEAENAALRARLAAAGIP